MLRFAHTGDLHFSNQLSVAGELVFDASTGNNVRLVDVERCFNSFADQAIDFGAQFMLVAGDVYDRVRCTPTEERVVIGCFDRLAADIPLIVITGNHDASGVPGEATAITSLCGRRGIHVAETPGYFDIAGGGGVDFVGVRFVEMAAGRPEFSDVLSLATPVARVFVLPWPSRAALMTDQANSDKTGEELNALVSERLAGIVNGMRQLRCDGIPNLLVAHLTIHGALINEQPAVLQADIGLRADDLRGFNYVAVGHIHARQQLRVSDGTTAFYAGSIDRFAFGEGSEPKGANLVEIDGDGTRVTFTPTPARPFRTLSVEDVMAGMPVSDDGVTVHRVKGDIGPDRVGELRERVEGMKLRFCKLDVEVTRQLRIRDAGIREAVSEEAMIRRRLESRGVPADKVPDFMSIHARIATGIRK